MYSESIIARNIERIEASITARRLREGQPGQPQPRPFRIVRFPEAVIAEMVERIERITDKQTGKFTRDLEPVEQAFIDNELTLCQLDARHYFENYCVIQLASQSDRPEGWDEADRDGDGPGGSGGRVGKFLLNGMQIQLLKKLARLEELCYEAMARGVPVNGILLILHKARQLGASTLWQALIMHRTNFYSFVNALVASIDDKSTQALFRRGERMYDNMPAWMRSPLKRRTRTDGFVFERDSVIELQYFQQAKDLGKGETWHAVHVTEAAVADRPEDHFDEGLFAAIPFSLYTLYGMESTSKGKRGWWYDFVTNVMSGTAEGGAGRFAHYFAPFYLVDMAEEARGQRSKYRIEAPVGWEPAINTQRMLVRVKQTSHQFCDTPNLILHRDVAYWYESTHAYFYKRGKLNIFKQNYPVDPYESFQHSTAGAYTTETIERLEGNCAGAGSDSSPWPYELVSADQVPARNAMVRALGDERLRVYDVGSYHLAPLDPAELEGDRDPRGIVWIFEQSAEQWHYVLGADPTGGIPGWQRAFRQQDDVKTDNGAIEVFRRGKPPKPCEPCAGRGWISLPDQRNVAIECRECEGRGKLGGRAVQVAEFAAPIDAEELALYIFVLGRVFRGSSQFPECLAVVESNNTGILTIRKLQTVYEYSNLYQTQSIDSAAAPKYLSGYGFFSGPSTVPILHARSRSIITRRDVDVRSQWLVREYSDSIVKITGSTDADSASAKATDKAIIVRERFYVPPGAGRHDDRAQASYLCYWCLFDWSEDSPMGEHDDAGPRALVPELAGRDATAAEQRQRWNDAAARYFDEDDIQLGGHYTDCAVECRADHGVDGDDQYGFDSDELPDDDALDDDGSEWPGEGGLFGRVD